MTPIRRAGLIVLVMVGLVAGLASPAHAATDVTAEVGVGGFFGVGKPVGVRVTVKADRLIKGTVSVSGSSFGSNTMANVPIEVAGGATKTVTVVVPTAVQDPGQSANFKVRVLNGSDEVAATEVSGSARVDQELVGVFPQLLAQSKPPETTKLIVDVGSARISAFDPAELDNAGFVESYDMLVALPADLTALPAPALTELLGWVGRGGRLMVKAPGTLAAIPPEWQPGVAGRAAAGRGEVVTVFEGTPWWNMLEPTPTRSALEDAGVNGGNIGGGFPIGNALAVDAGFTVARVTWLLAFLGIYVVVVGPVAYLVLKRLKRPGLLWLVVPALAGLFTVTASVIGKSQQHPDRSGYSAAVETSPGGSWSTSSIGSLASGGSVKVTLPEGWRSAAASAGPWFGGGGQPAAEARSTVTKSGIELSKVTGVDQFETLTAAGPVNRLRSYEVVANATDNSTVIGTVKNVSPNALRDVAVFSGFGAVRIDGLAAGETKPFTITDAAKPLDFRNGPFDPRSSVWPEINFNNGMPQQDPNAAVSSAQWSAFLQDAGSNALRLGRVLVVGWSRTEPSVLPSNGTSSGRTALIQDEPVTAAGLLFAPAIRADVVRAPGVFGGGPNGEIVTAYTLPNQAATPQLVFRRTGGDQQVDVWVNDAWKSVSLNDSVIPLPFGSVRDGRVYVRTSNQFDGQPRGFVLSGAG